VYLHNVIHYPKHLILVLVLVLVLVLPQDQIDCLKTIVYVRVILVILSILTIITKILLSVKCKMLLFTHYIQIHCLVINKGISYFIKMLRQEFDYTKRIVDPKNLIDRLIELNEKVIQK